MEFESPDLKIWIILAVLKHSGKILSDTEILKSIETIGEIIGAKILYINTGIFMRSVDLFFCLRIRLTISSLSEGKNFPQVLPGNSMELYLGEEYCDQDWRLRLKNSY